LLRGQLTTIAVWGMPWEQRKGRSADYDITDTEVRIKGLQVLAKYLGDIETECFIALIQREPFDYTKWRQDLDEDPTINGNRGRLPKASFAFCK
jgi:hypothetical protein